MLGLVWVAVVLQNAWVCDDAFITLRTVRNILEGRGPTFNPGERVQTYTHPLWMLVLALAHAITREPFYGTLCMSVLAGSAALYVAMMRIAIPMAIVPIGMAACLSRALVEYSTSGLENPALHLVLAVAAWAYLARLPNRTTATRATVLLSLAVLVRPDAFLLLAPLWLATLHEAHRRGTSRSALLRATAVGLIPVVAWELFALIYYGSLVPNTAIAKLGTGVPTTELWMQGLLYLWVTLTVDPLTAVVIVSGLAAAVTAGRRGQRPLAAGIGVYLVYVVSIGGDFMMGRFLTPPAWLALLILARDRRWDRRSAVVASALTMSLAFVGERPPVLTGPDDVWRPDQPRHRHGVSDERAFYARGSSLWTAWQGGSPPVHRWRELGEHGRKHPSKVVVFSTMGLYGYYAPPHIHIIDGFALADPLLARLPARRQVDWRAGHLSRPFPTGFLRSRRERTNEIEDPAVARLHDALIRVHRGEPWSIERFAEIARLHLGLYMDDIDFERYRYFDAPEIGLDEIERAGDPVVFSGTGVRVHLATQSHATVLRMRASGDQTYAVRLYRGKRMTARSPCRPPASAGPETVVVECPVDEQLAASGYDQLHIVPTKRHGQKKLELVSIELGRRP